jgi:ADP-ribosyl-[dinitrogen reductase] hydrolase
MEVLHLPIPDSGVPPEDPETDEYGDLIGDIARRLKRGQTVVVHCRGGLGRSGMVASVLVALGHPAVKALEIVRRSREGAVETPEQEDHVHFYEMRFGSDSAKDI